MKKQQIKASIAAVVLGVLSPLAMFVPAGAVANMYWTGNAENNDGLGSQFYNWEDLSVPISGNSLHFGADGINQTIDLDIMHNAPVSESAVGSMDLLDIVFDGEWVGSDTSNKNYAISSDYIINLSGDIRSIMTGTAGGNQSIDASISLQADSIFKTDASSALVVGGTATTLDLGAKTLTLNAGGGSITLQGKIAGTGNIVKAGTGQVNILTTPATGGYTGSIDLPTGEIVATGTLGAITISGGTLKGTGTVGAVTMSSGIVAPGASPGTLNTGALAFTGGTHQVELGGKAAGEFDQLNVLGGVNLGSATDLSIALSGSYAPALKDSFVIINNDGTDAVEGTFKGLKEGGKVIGAYTYQVSYKGGDGNDVVLTVTGNPSAPDTGSGSLISSPIATLVAAVMAAGLVAGYRIYELKKIKK